MNSRTMTRSWRPGQRVSLACGSLLSAAMLLAAPVAHADVVEDACMQDIAGFGLNCTANDVRVANVTNLKILDDGCAFLGDTVTFEADYHILLTAQARHDIGIYFATDGDPNGNGAISGGCTIATLPYNPDPPWLDLDGVGDDPGGVTQDTCGDIDESHKSLVLPLTITATCIDDDNNGNLDLPNCTSWRQPGANDLCTSPLDAYPGAPSKCRCEPGFQVEIEVPDPCEGNPCDDGLFCNGLETCDPILGCLAGTPPVCDDGVGCTDDSCNETTDSCESVTNDGNCDDGLFCNGVETCDPTLDCQAGAGPDCDDGVVCTDDSCNETTDSCDNVVNDGNCNDGLFCNGVETCDPALDCQAGTAPDCTDGVGCTDDSCNEDTDSCDNVANDVNCDDGLFCTGVEICDPALDCQAGRPPDCSDGVGCTADVCSSATDTCVSTPRDSRCDDGLFCNGVETCDAVLDCQPGTAVVCDDSVGCTVDSCNEVTDSCDAFADDSLCDDGQFCNGTETCDLVADCQAGTPPTCDDSNVCTTDSCDDGAGACVHDFDTSAAPICEGICRTAGFWGSRGGDEKGFNYTQAVIDAAGCLEVCGVQICGTDSSSPTLGIDTLGSALEGLCLPMKNKSQLDQSFRQMVAASLNCVLSGAGGDVCGDFLNQILIGVTWEECNYNCSLGGSADDALLTTCLQQLDCWNNGRQLIDLGGGNWACAVGTCSLEDPQAYCEADYAKCAANQCNLATFSCTVDGLSCLSDGDCAANSCVPFVGCHDRGLCDSMALPHLQNPYLVCPPGADPEALGPASSSRLCHSANRSKCTIATPDQCVANPCGDYCP